MMESWYLSSPEPHNMAIEYENSLKPSQYTCMLLDQAVKYYSKPSCKSVLDMGVGSGVMLLATH